MRRAHVGARRTGAHLDQEEGAGRAAAGGRRPRSDGGAGGGREAPRIDDRQVQRRPLCDRKKGDRAECILAFTVQGAWIGETECILDAVVQVKSKKSRELKISTGPVVCLCSRWNCRRPSRRDLRPVISAWTSRGSRSKPQAAHTTRPRAVQLGLWNRVVPDEQLRPTVDALVEVLLWKNQSSAPA